jgi:uncharacterized protein
MRCWGITPGSAGMVAQVKALAGALNVTPEMKTVDFKLPWSILPNAVHAGLSRPLILPLMTAPGSDRLTAPWPDLVISCGRRGALAAMGLRARAKNARFIHIQDPQCDPKHFDLVVAMEHDKVRGPNVLTTRFALHSITPDALEKARHQFAPYFAAYARPHVAVLLGGSTNKYQLNETRMATIVLMLKYLLGKNPGSLLITPSRRTGEDNIAMLKAAFANDPRVYIYGLAGDNPYLGMLALADYLVVSNDSVNMMTDACATGKPLYLLPLPGHDESRPAQFGSMLVGEGIARLAGEKLESWKYSVPDEMGPLAYQIRNRLTLA